MLEKSKSLSENKERGRVGGSGLQPPRSVQQAAAGWKATCHLSCHPLSAVQLHTHRFVIPEKGSRDRNLSLNATEIQMQIKVQVRATSLLSF